MIVEVARLASGTILSGAASGRRLFAKLVEALPAEPACPEPLFLNFENIEVATASFLRESVLAFRTFVRGRKSNFYPAVANATAEVIDEFVELVQQRGDVVMICTVDEDGHILRCRPVGKLDPTQQKTFEMVRSLGEATAAKLMSADNNRVKSTAWNNRLASLSALGLLSEQSHGRTKTYKAMFVGGNHGR